MAIMIMMVIAAWKEAVEHSSLLCGLESWGVYIGLLALSVSGGTESTWNDSALPKIAART